MQENSKIPWQLQMYRRSLKKQLKMDALIKLSGNLANQKCLLVTCGDNNGALNWCFRNEGGLWTWADVSDENLVEMSKLLGEPVQQVSPNQLPFADNSFDCVVSIDVLEHLDDPILFTKEMGRVLRPGGQAVVTVPNGDPALLANQIKWKIGMSPEKYGHTRAGYTIAELKDVITAVGLVPKREGGYSRFFTEMMELIINYAYVFVLSRKEGKENSGQIAPATSGELKTHGLAYRLYGIAYPLMRAVSALDVFLPASSNNAVIVTATK